MATKSVIRTQTRIEIDQTDSSNSDYTDAQLDVLIDDAINHIATLSNYPRVFTEITPVTGTADYDISSTGLTNGTINIMYAYYGNKAVSGSVGRLKITTEAKLRSIYPGWLETANDSNGEPFYLIRKTPNTITVFPKPSADSVSAGNKIILHRSYYPASLSSDSASPDLPESYHQLIKFLVAFYCYSGKLKNQEMALSKFNMFNAIFKQISAVEEKEIEDGYEFGFISDEGLNAQDSFISF